MRVQTKNAPATDHSPSSDIGLAETGYDKVFSMLLEQLVEDGPVRGEVVAKDSTAVKACSHRRQEKDLFGDLGFEKTHCACAHAELRVVGGLMELEVSPMRMFIRIIAFSAGLDELKSSHFYRKMQFPFYL